MGLLQEAVHLLRVYKIIPKKRLGQNFLVNEDLLNRLVSYGNLDEEDVVLEIGAGLGFLTRVLSPKCKRVIALEIDPRLVNILRRRLSGLHNVSILRGDVLKIPVPPFNKVVSTPPYSISSPLLFWLLERDFESAVLTFQKEFAERLSATPNSKDYGRITVTIYYRAQVELLNYVPRDMFWPQPDVDSLIVRIKPRTPPFSVRTEKIFFDLVRGLFSQKNRKVRNAIKPFLNQLSIPKRDYAEWLDSLSFLERRPRELAPEDFGLMADEIVEKLCEKSLL